MKICVMIILGICVILVLIVMVGCSCLKKDDGLCFDGECMCISVKWVDKDDCIFFIVIVGLVVCLFEGVKGVVYYGGIEYCIENFGILIIKWDVDFLSEEVVI